MTQGNVTIALTPDIKEKLKKMKLHPRESFNDVVKRLIAENEKKRR